MLVYIIRFGYVYVFIERIMNSGIFYIHGVNKHLHSFVCSFVIRHKAATLRVVA